MLAQTISDIVQCRQTIENHKFDETATKQYVVLPILRSLDWQDDNLYTLEVFPEKRVGDGKVDYALQHDQTSLVFIECKRWGASIEKYQAQICQYAFQAGIEIAVITNGKIWDFYLPNLTSTSERRIIPWEDRIFCSINLEIQREAVSDFQKYLSKSNVEQGKSKKEAEEAFQPRLPDTPLPRQNYGLPILRALKSLGGSGATHQVLDMVYQFMNAANELREIDKSRRSDGQFYWDNRTQDMRRELISKGLMKDDSPWGIWEISNAGLEHLLDMDVQKLPQPSTLGTSLHEHSVESSDTPLPRISYALPILKALSQLGGSAVTSEVLRTVRHLMEDELKPIDLSQRPAGHLYWENRVHDMRRELINQGLMMANSPRGIWEISDVGREYLCNKGEV